MLVAVCGPAGSGKSALVSSLARHGFRELMFAEPLKRIVKDIFGFSDRALYGPSSARSEPHPTMRRPDGSPLTARHALQTMGTDWARQMCCDTVWVDYAMRKAAEMGGNVAISDCRFRNELDAIKAAGGICVRRTSSVPVTDMHPTEQEMLSVPDSEFDAVIHQLSSLADLHRVVDELVAKWRTEGRL